MAPKPAGRVTIEAGVSPSEDARKVALAVDNIVGDSGLVEITVRGARFRSDDLGSLGHLRDQLRDRRIRAAARRLLLRERDGKSAVLMLNRQAAFVGVIALCGSPEESPLGPVYLTLESKDMEAAIDWLTAYEEG